MMEYINIFLKSVFMENMIFAFFLGMCSYLAVSKKVSTAIGLGVAVIFVQIITVPINYLIYKYVLEAGALKWLDPSYATLDLSFLAFILFIASVATMVQLVEMLVEKFSPSLYNSLGIFLPLIAVNCAILGGSLFMQQRVDGGVYSTFGHVMMFSFASGLSWLIAIVALAAIREKMQYSNVLAPLKGLGITFITTGLMAIGFMAFGGIDIKALAKEKEMPKKVTEKVEPIEMPNEVEKLLESDILPDNSAENEVESNVNN